MNWVFQLSRTSLVGRVQALRIRFKINRYFAMAGDISGLLIVFEYDQQTGDIASHGEVLIDLEANPQGLNSADQASPRELKYPIHLRTTDVVCSERLEESRVGKGSVN